MGNLAPGDNVDRDTINTITESVLAVLIVGGGGAALVFRPESVPTVLPLITLVLGWYFTQRTQVKATNGTLTATTKIADQISSARADASASTRATMEATEAIHNNAVASVTPANGGDHAAGGT